jgi:hypothetical protein
MSIPDRTCPIKVEQHEAFSVISHEDVGITKVAMNIAAIVIV